MAQESPTRLLYAQAIQLIQQLQALYGTAKNKTPDEIAVSINSILSRFSENAGKTQTNYEPVYISEVPQSEKMNRFWTSLQNDINILQDQVDILNASTVFSHNFIKTEILKAQQENSRLQNKIKTLELYSNTDNDSLVYLGDSFITEDFIDWNLVSDGERATLVSNGHLSLNVTSQDSAINSKTSVQILNDSNGFIGNNQEILDPNSTITDIHGQQNYTFVAEGNKNADLESLIDSEPNTCIEYEKYLIKPEDRALAKGYNFNYSVTKTHWLNPDGSDNLSGVSIDWADGPSNNILNFSFEIDLGEDRQVNIINLSPYGLNNNVNNPIKIVNVSTSLTKTNWAVLGPENVWISNSIDKKISSINAENILIGSATWITDGGTIRYIRFTIEQFNPIDCNVGHLYYVNKDTPASIPEDPALYPVADSGSMTYNTSVPYDSPVQYGGPLINDVFHGSYDGSGIIGGIVAFPDEPHKNKLIQFETRVEGPNPPVENPHFYLDPKNIQVNDYIQKREYFHGKRWAIGIKDISIDKYIYNVKGIIISKKFNIPGVIDRVALEANIAIPDSYDKSINWIQFFVSPDDGLTWNQISRIQDDFLSLPEIIAFNDPTPTALREPGVFYSDVKGTVNSLRVKIEITRPSDNQTSTPIVHSYKLKIIKRD